MAQTLEVRLDKEGFTGWLESETAFRAEDWPTLEKLARTLPSILSEARCRHVYSVACTADALAERFGVDRTCVLLAALGHDLAKERRDLRVEEWKDFPPAEIDTGVLAVPALHHSALGVVVMVREFGVEDPLVLQAIRYHSTGRAGLSPVGRVLFVADYIEPLRKDPSRARLEEVCRRNLDRGCLEVLRGKLLYLIQRSRRIHRNSWEFWNELVSLGIQNGENEN